ncbi:MAG: hypothetical protein IT207_02715 [Fimbriimonadaceae bacterium]|nr:hypothetical protein [Fimbriimonadaceae bacterium]
MNVLSLLLAGSALPALGTNLAPLDSGGSAWPFWDVARSASPWAKSGSEWRMELVAAGTPHPPYGKFVATWEGGSLSLAGGTTLAVEAGKLEFEVGETGASLVFKGDTVPRAKVLAPGFNPSWAGTYRPVYLQRLRVYPVLRLSSWRSMNGVGVPVADLTQLLRETNSSPWLSVEEGTSLAQVRAEADRWAATLPQGATVILDAAANDDEASRHFEAFKGALGPGRTLVRVLRLDSAEEAKEVVAKVSASDADALSVPMRFGRATAAKRNLDMATSLASLDGEVTSLLASAKGAQEAARRNRWSLLCHDGGLELPDPPGATQPERDALDALARNQGLTQIYLKLLRGWRSLEGSLFCHASECAPLHRQNRAGALEWIEQDTMASPTRAALVEFALFPDR